MLVGSGARSGRRHAFTLIELVVTIVVVALLAGIAWTGFRAAILHSHDTKALAAVDAIGSGVGVLGALGGGTDFDYSEPSVRQAVASPSGLVNPGGKTSGRYSEYGWAMGTDPVTKTARSMVVMRSESGACAAGVFAGRGAKAVLELLHVDVCAADGRLGMRSSRLSGVVTLPIPAKPPALVVLKDGRSTSAASFMLSWKRPSGDVSGYRVWSYAAPQYADAPSLVGVVTAPGSGWGKVAELPPEALSYAVPLEHYLPDDNRNGRWLLFYVTAVNAEGEGDPSNLVPVIDGFEDGRGLWEGCRTATDAERIVVQIPDSAPYPAPVTWTMTNNKGTVLRSGTATTTGPVFADVAPNTKIGDLTLTYADGTTLLMSAANSSAPSDKGHATLSACPT